MVWRYRSAREDPRLHAYAEELAREPVCRPGARGRSWAAVPAGRRRAGTRRCPECAEAVVRDVLEA